MGPFLHLKLGRQSFVVRPYNRAGCRILSEIRQNGVSSHGRGITADLKVPGLIPGSSKRTFGASHNEFQQRPIIMRHDQQQLLIHGQGCSHSTGVKKSATKNQRETQMAVRPVRPPSRMPEADSMKAAIGEVPMRLPSTLLMPSTQKANVCLGNSFFSFTKPAPVEALKHSCARASRGQCGEYPAWEVGKKL